MKTAHITENEKFLQARTIPQNETVLIPTSMKWCHERDRTEKSANIKGQNLGDTMI